MVVQNSEYNAQNQETLDSSEETEKTLDSIIKDRKEIQGVIRTEGGAALLARGLNELLDSMPEENKEKYSQELKFKGYDF